MKRSTLSVIRAWVILALALACLGIAIAIVVGHFIH